MMLPKNQAEVSGSKLILPVESFKTIGICMAVHRILKHRLLENVYKDALELEFNRHHISHTREKQYKVEYKGTILRHHQVADFVVLDRIILEVKAVDNLNPSHFVQIINYAKHSRLPLGILVNFGSPSLQFQWIANDRRTR